MLTICYRVFKKSSSNNKLTLYLASRDLVVSAGKIDRLQGVLLVDPDYLQDKKVRMPYNRAMYQFGEKNALSRILVIGSKTR